MSLSVKNNLIEKINYRTRHHIDYANQQLDEDLYGII